MAKIEVLDQKITIVKGDFISLTDIARSKNSDEPKDVVKNWLRNKNTIEFLGLWEKINNPDSKGVEYDHFKMSFGMTAKQWQESNLELKGNIRDYADVNQLVCLANLESLNAHLITEGLSQQERVEKLNAIAIGQMKILLGDKSMKKLEGKR